MFRSAIRKPIGTVLLAALVACVPVQADAQGEGSEVDALERLLGQDSSGAVGGDASESGAEQTPSSDSETLPTIRVAAEQGAPESLAAPRRRPPAIEEIVVTANKRSESLSSIAGAVSAIDEAQLKEAGASGFGDYLSLSPGVNFNSGVPGYSVITIRGVSSDTVPSLAQTAVGVYYDDIPLTDPAAPMVVPDIDAFDAQRVEVLRGGRFVRIGVAGRCGELHPRRRSAAGRGLRRPAGSRPPTASWGAAAS